MLFYQNPKLYPPTQNKIHYCFCRMHAEFQLNEPPTDPFWFTPAQFVGDLVISKNGSHVEYFHMHVPASRRLNVGKLKIIIKIIV